jgi:hypothetical protein
MIEVTPSKVHVARHGAALVPDAASSNLIKPDHRW